MVPFFRLLYVAMTELAYFMFFQPFWLASQSCPTLSTPCCRLMVPSYGFLLVFSVPYMLSGNRHFQRYFELHEYLLADPILACFIRLNSLATFAGIVPVIS